MRARTTWARDTRRAIAVIGLGAALTAPARGAAAAPALASWWSLGILGGTTRPDPAFADYQWDTQPRLAWGAEMLVGTGPVAGGARVWRTGTTQVVDPSGPTVSTTVHVTTWDLVGQGRVATVWGTEVLAMASAGVAALAYDPDRVAVATGGPGGSVTVDLEPITEWNAAAGLALRRPLGHRWSAGLELDHRVFRLDTAHRSGNQIEIERRGFGDWSARLGLAWLVGRR